VHATVQYEGDVYHFTKISQFNIIFNKNNRLVWMRCVTSMFINQNIKNICNVEKKI
jgi:hypothetical protein